MSLHCDILAATKKQGEKEKEASCKMPAVGAGTRPNGTERRVENTE